MGVMLGFTGHTSFGTRLPGTSMSRGALLAGAGMMDREENWLASKEEGILEVRCSCGCLRDCSWGATSREHLSTGSCSDA